MATNLFKSLIFVLLLLLVYVPASEHHETDGHDNDFETLDQLLDRDQLEIDAVQKDEKPKKDKHKPPKDGDKHKGQKDDDHKGKQHNHDAPRNPYDKTTVHPGGVKHDHHGAPAGHGHYWMPAGKPSGDYETDFLGAWKVDNNNAGVSAMHMQVLRNNKAIIFDATNFGESGILLQPAGNCFIQKVPNQPDKVDCWAHAIEYDLATSQIRTLKLTTNSWCSSGGTTPEGLLIGAGGTDEGGRVVRILDLCPNCDWQENVVLGRTRWYSSQEKLEDGSFIIVGGRREASFEFVQNSLNFQPRVVELPFLRDNGDLYENNLYPFTFLLPDGNIFLFANRQGAILDPKSTNIIRKFPNITGSASRNYPGSAGAALLPLKLKHDNSPENVEVLICGGAMWDATRLAEQTPRVFMPAVSDCGRIAVMNPNAEWETDNMPSPRVMGDMILLPTGNVLLINGAMSGCAGWYDADDPNYKPVMYYPNKPLGQRFKELAPTTIPRMYHSSAAVLPEGNILVAGSSANSKYEFNPAITKYPTELRVEKFTPPYMDRKLDQHRPWINEQATEKVMKYGSEFVVIINDLPGVVKEDLMASLLPPPFTTHGYSQNQRLVIPYVLNYEPNKLTVQAPPSGKIAPPGYYLLSVVNRGVPSRAMWLQIKN